MDGSGLAAVRTEHECVKAPLPEVLKTPVRDSSSGEFLKSNTLTG